MISDSQTPGLTEWVQISAGIFVPRRISAQDHRPESIQDAVVSLVAEWDEELNAYDVTEVSMRRAAGVTSAVLRQLPIRASLRQVVREAARALNPETGVFERVTIDLDRIRDLAADGPRNPATLREVGRVYALANAVLDPPTAAVAETFGIPSRTASHWVKLAKDRGHLAVRY